MADSNFSEDRVRDNILAQSIPEEIHEELIAAILENPIDKEANPKELIDKMIAVMQANPLTNGRDFHIDDSFLGKLNFALSSSEIDNSELVTLLQANRCFCGGQMKPCPC